MMYELDEFMKHIKVITKIESILNENNIEYEYLAKKSLINSVFFALKGSDSKIRAYGISESNVHISEWIKSSYKNIKSGDFTMCKDFLVLEDCSFEDFHTYLENKKKDDKSHVLTIRNKSLSLKK